MQLRYAAYAALALLVAVIAGAFLLASDTGPQPTTYALTTSATENGGVSPLPGTYTYLDGESVTVTATPDEGYRVSLWSGDCSGTATTCVLTLDADRTASVTFERITHTLTVTATGDGSVTPAGTTTHDEGDEATLTATPDEGYRVSLWSGDCSGTATTCVLTLDADRTASVTFERITHTLTVTATGDGSVTPAGTTTHDEGDEATLTATPDEGYRVSLWSGDCSGTATTCVLTLDADRTASVTFERITHTLTVTATGDGSVTPAGTTTHDEGDEATLTATPDEGYRVSLWSGDCSGTATTCVLTLDADRTASVTFERITHTLTVTATGDGSVTPAGTTTQYESDEVTLRASWSDATHSFDGWGGDCSGTASTCLLTMDANKSVTATFTALPANRCAAPTDADCIRAIYLGAPGDYAQVTDIPASGLLTPEADGRYYVERGHQISVVTAAPLPTGYTRFWLDRTPLEFGTPSSVSFSQLIKPVGTTYTFTVAEDEDASTLITFDLTAARPHPVRPTHKPELGDVVVTTTFSVGTSVPRYDSYDTTGALTTPGSYGFLSDAADTTTVITTYEGLRDGTTMALIMHESDAHGASQAALYDAVAAGDLFEWHKTDDCFVRYQVTEVRPDPIGSVPRKLLAVEWMTYAYSGCSGAVSTSATASIMWGALPDLGGASLRFPVRHGPFHLVPTDWAGAVEAREALHVPTSYDWDIVHMADPDPAVARAFPYWREPALPAEWRLRAITRGTVNDPPWGYTALYGTDGGIAVQISGYHQAARGWAEEASWHNGGSVYETRMIDGRPARVMYSLPGPSHNPLFPVAVWIYDPATETGYSVDAFARRLRGGNVDAVIAIVRSLFESPNPQ